MTCPRREALEADDLSPEAKEHVLGCEACQKRVRWARREAAAVRAWAAKDAPVDLEHLWARVETALEARPSRRRWIALGAVAAVLALAVVFRPMVEEGESASAAVAMGKAEREYQGAIATLESQVEARRRPGRQAAALGRARTGLARARASAGTDPSARQRILEGYAAYLKSLRRALQEDGP